MIKTTTLLVLAIATAGCEASPCGGGETMAVIMGPKFVARQLKNPESFEVSKALVNELDAKSCLYEVFGTGYATNSFGGVGQIEFYTNVAYNPETGNWRGSNTIVVE